MKVNELRIGNWIHLSSLTDGTETDLECGLFHMEEMNKSIKYQYKPILLTEEWLEKFGFFEKYGGCYNRWNIKSFTLIDPEDDYGNLKGEFIFNHTLEVKHVHQLQNLYFALTGEELTIK